MSATDEELTTLGPQLGALLDRAEIQDLLDRYVFGIASAASSTARLSGLPMAGGSDS
jgi:hypothetical protein